MPRRFLLWDHDGVLVDTEPLYFEATRDALARFGADPAEVLALEDSAQGLAAARAAGLDCVVIRNPFMRAQDFRGAWRMLDSVRELPALLAG